jgi:lipopolysaccharide transport system ATP-binding protein
MNAIEVRGVSKTFRIPHERQTTLVERILSSVRPPTVEVLRALDDVSLEIPHGSFAGIIGANGSGKSTLLKIIAGVFVPDTGQVRVTGSLVPLLELGVGFQPELTLRENVALYGAVIGYPKHEVADRVHQVLAFAELERFRDAKLKSLSSGMRMRLAFATAVHARAEIMLLDEVMAVGDARFQQKCLEVFEDLKRQKRTIVLVTHDLASAQRFCDHLVWMDKGKVVMAGDAVQVVHTYVAVCQTAWLPQQSPLYSSDVSEHRFGDGGMRFVGATLEAEDGRPVTSVSSGQNVTLRLEAEVHASTEPTFGVIVRRGEQIAYHVNNAFLGIPTGRVEPGDRCFVTMPLRASLANGHYSVSIAVANTANGGVVHDWVNHALTFLVVDSPSSEGVADLGASFTWSVAPAARRAPGTATGS